MAEPTSTTGSAGLLSLFVVLLGPMAGPYVFVLFGALIGAATALSEQPSSGHARGALFLIRVMFISLLFTAPLTAALADYTHLSVEVLMGVVAYAIGWKFDTVSLKVWPAIQSRLLGAARGPQE